MDVIQFPLCHVTHYRYKSPMSPYAIAFHYNPNSIGKKDMWDKVSHTVMIHDEILDWLGSHGYSSSLTLNDDGDICFTFTDPKLAMLFKLTWL